MKLSLYTKNILTAIIFALFSTTAVHAAVPACVTQVSPASDATVTKSPSNDYTFSWTAGDAETVGYEVRITTNSDGSGPYLLNSALISPTKTTETFTVTLNCNTLYYWAAIPFGLSGGTPPLVSAPGCTFTPFTVIPAPAPVASPTDAWSVSVYGDVASSPSAYAGYYTQNNTGLSGLGLYFSTATAWTSSNNPSTASANSGTNTGTPPGTGTYSVTAFQGCALAGNTNYSYIYKRTSTLAEGIYTISFTQTTGTGNTLTFKVNDITVINSSTSGTPVVTCTIPANAALTVISTHGTTATNSTILRTVALANPAPLLPGSLIADKEICYGNSSGPLAGGVASGGCTFKYQWQKATAFAGPYSDIVGATTSTYTAANLTATTYFKRVVTDLCGSVEETPVLTITVGPNNYLPGSIAYSDLSQDTICTGSTPAAFNSLSPASGGPSFVTYTYQWVTATNTAIAGETNETYTPTAGITATTSYRRRMNVVGCTTAPAALYTNAISIVVQQSAPTTAPTITGPAAICDNQTGLSYVASAIAGAFSYTWTVPAGVTITAGQGTRILTVDTDGTYTGGNLTVAAVNACGVGLVRTLVLTNATTCISTWDGSSSSVWGTAANWTPAVVPSAAMDVVIPVSATNMPIVTTGTANAASLTIDLGATVTVSGGILSVTKDFTVNGTLTQTAGVIRFVGSNTQTFTSAANPQVFKGITLNGTGVSFSSPVSLEGTVILTLGTLTTNNNVTLKPDNGGIVAFVNGNLGTVSGQVTVIKAIAPNWRYISSPLEGVTATQLSDDMLVSNGGSTSRLSTYDYSIPGFKSRTDLASVQLGSGGAAKLFVPAAGGTISVDFTGTINNTGSFTSSVISNSIANRSIFVGNPYPSSLNIDATSGWAFTGVSPTFYFWDSNSNTFLTYQKGSPGVGTASNIIPMFQAFFLKTTGAGGNASVTMGPRTRITTAGSLYRTTLADDILRFKVTSSTTSASDETIVRLSDIGSIEFDTLDSYKFRNPSTSINVFTKSDDIEYVINTVPTSAETVVPLNLIVPANGTYSITVPTSTTSEVVLKDKLLNIEKVADGTDYVFTAATTDNEARFEVLFRTSLTTGTRSSASAVSNINIASTGKSIVVIAKNSLSNSTLRVYNAVGVLVLEVPNTSIAAGTNVLEDISLESGAYIIKISNDGNEYIGHTNIVK